MGRKDGGKKRKRDVPEGNAVASSTEVSAAGTPSYEAEGASASPSAGAALASNPSSPFSQSVSPAFSLNKLRLDNNFIACINVNNEVDGETTPGMLTWSLQKILLVEFLSEHGATEKASSKQQKQPVGDKPACSAFCFTLNHLFEGMRSTQESLPGNQKNQGNKLARDAMTLDEGLSLVYLNLHKYGLRQHGARLADLHDGELRDEWKSLRFGMIQQFSSVKIKNAVKVLSTVAPGILHFVCEGVNHMAKVAAAHKSASKGVNKFAFPLVNTNLVSKTLTYMLSGTGVWCCHLMNRVDVYMMSLVALLGTDDGEDDTKCETWMDAFTEEAIFDTVLHQLFLLQDTLDEQGSKYKITTKAFLSGNVNLSGDGAVTGAEALDMVYASFHGMVWYEWHNLINKHAHTQLLKAHLARRESDYEGTDKDQVAIVLRVDPPVDGFVPAVVLVDYDKLAYITDAKEQITGAKGFMAALEEQFGEGGAVHMKLSEASADENLKVVLEEGFKVSDCAILVVDVVAQYEFADAAVFSGFSSQFSCEKPDLQTLEVSVFHRERTWILPSQETLKIDNAPASGPTFIGEGPCMVPEVILKRTEQQQPRYSSEFQGSSAGVALTNVFRGLNLAEGIKVHGGIVVTIKPPVKFRFALKPAVARGVRGKDLQNRRPYAVYCDEVQFDDGDFTLTPMESLDSVGCIQDIGDVYNVLVGGDEALNVDTTGEGLSDQLHMLVNNGMRLCMLVRSRPIDSVHNGKYADPDGELQLLQADNTVKAVDLRFLWRYCETSPVSSLSEGDKYKSRTGRIADINNSGALKWFCGEMRGDETGPSFVEHLQERFGVDPDFKLEDLNPEDFPEEVEGHFQELNEGGSVKFTKDSVVEIKRVFADNLVGTLAEGAVHLVVLPEWYPNDWIVNG